MQQHSSINSGCIKNLIASNCNCQIHVCIKQIINLKTSQFNHLIKLLDLFASPYKICDLHNYPFEFFSEKDKVIKCKFCLHENSQLQLIQKMTFQDTQINLKKELMKFPDSSNYIKNKFDDLWSQNILDLQQDSENQTEIDKKWMERIKLKETIEFLKLTTPTEVHNEFHNAMENIKLIDQIGNESLRCDVLKLRDFLLQK